MLQRHEGDTLDIAADLAQVLGQKFTEALDKSRPRARMLNEASCVLRAGDLRRPSSTEESDCFRPARQEGAGGAASARPPAGAGSWHIAQLGSRFEHTLGRDRPDTLPLD